MSPAHNKYKILEKLGAGGMAEVYRGEIESIEGFRKAVAIKRILPSLTKHPKFVAMFLDEARLSLSLNHTNVVQVFDIGQAGATYFLVMEFVDGLNLRQMIDTLRRRHRRFTTELAVFIGIELCKGLAYAHELVDRETGKPLGIVHRDVSPPNVLLSRMGEVKVTDFGLAKAAVQVVDTEPGVVKGKFSYLAPEAAMGLEVDHRSDIFACGILIFEMLTGKRLFYGQSDWETVELVRQAHIPPLTPLNPDVQDELDRILRKSLARDPNDRYQHAGDLAEQLAHHLFARSLKVTNRDLAKTVSQCLTVTREIETTRSSELVQSIVEEEMRRFASLDAEATVRAAAVMEARDDFGGASAELIDTTKWADEIGDVAAVPDLSGKRSRSSTPPPIRPPTPTIRARTDLTTPTPLRKTRPTGPVSKATTPGPASQPPQQASRSMPAWLIVLIFASVTVALGLAALALKAF